MSESLSYLKYWKITKGFLLFLFPLITLGSKVLIDSNLLYKVTNLIGTKFTNNSWLYYYYWYCYFTITNQNLLEISIHIFTKYLLPNGSYEINKFDKKNKWFDFFFSLGNLISQNYWNSRKYYPREIILFYSYLVSYLPMSTILLLEHMKRQNKGHAG